MLTRTSIEDYFNQLNELLLTNRPYEYDAPVLEQFARLGIGPGLKFDINKLSPAVVNTMEEFGRTDVPTTARLFAEKGFDDRLRALCCRFGTSYYDRYYSLFGGLGGNLMVDAVYYWLTTDTNGASLNGSKNYIIHFGASQIPQVRAFWSLTLYTKDFFMAKNHAVEPPYA